MTFYNICVIKMFLYTVNVNQFLLFESKFDTKLLTMTHPIKDQEKMYFYFSFHLQSSNCIAAGIVVDYLQQLVRMFLMDLKLWSCKYQQWISNMATVTRSQSRCQQDFHSVQRRPLLQHSQHSQVCTHPVSDPLARSAQGEPEPAQAVEVEAAALTPFRCLAAATL